MAQISLSKKKDAKKERVVIAFTIIGVVIVFVIWLLQLQSMLSPRSVENFQVNFAQTAAQFQAGIEYSQEVEQYVPGQEGTFEAMFSQVEDLISAEAAKQNTLNAVAQEMIEELEAEVAGEVSSGEAGPGLEPEAEAAGEEPGVQVTN
ncbi:hypothetical protein IH979_00475 [Patescibacteria group bacterium]|nr:hypothetical protein [Patescibacteria group bacterium]